MDDRWLLIQGINNEYTSSVGEEEDWNHILLEAFKRLRRATGLY